MKIQILGAVIALFVTEAVLALIVTLRGMGLNIYDSILVVTCLGVVTVFGGQLIAIYLTSPSKN
jgi:hypothetical protein